MLSYNSVSAGLLGGIEFFGNSDEASDEALRSSCEKNGNVVAGSYINYTSAYKTDKDGKGYIDHFSIESVEQLPVSRLAAALISAAAATLVFILSKKLKVRFSLPVAIATLIGYGICGVMLNAHGSTIPLAYCTVFIPVAFLFNLIRRYAIETIEKRKITAAFKK